MQRFWQSLSLCAFALLVLATPSQAEEFADVDFHLSRDCVGDDCKFSIDNPTNGKPKYWIAQNDPPVQNEFYALTTWDLNLGAPIQLGDSYSYVIWVESTNVQEITLRTTLFITWIDTSVDPAESRFTNISIDEVGKSASFGEILSGNYTVELEGSTLDKSEFPNGVPAYTTLGMKLETKIRWAPDTDNNTAWIKADTPDFDSLIKMNFRHVDIADDTSYFENNRVEAVNEDSLLVKVIVTNALGADNLDTSSASIDIDGVSGGGVFKDSVLVKARGNYAKYIQGTWHYQEDQNIVTGTYEIDFSIEDTYGNIWSASLDYELVVDEYGLEIQTKIPDGEEDTWVKTSKLEGQLARGGDDDYEFYILNKGNTRDIFTIEIDDSTLPSGWSATLKSPTNVPEHDLNSEIRGQIVIQIEAPVSVAGGSKEYVDVIITSISNSAVSEIIRLDAVIKTYGVVFLSPPDKVNIDPDDLDIDGNYYFSINLRNTGNDKDTYRLESSVGANGWTSRTENTAGTVISAVTIDKSQTQKIIIVLNPKNYDRILGDAIGFSLTASSISPGDGLAELTLDIIIDISPDKLSDLSINIDDISINGKPFSLLTEDDLSSTEPIQIRLIVYNLGGKNTVPFGVKLLDQTGKELDEYSVEQGVRGYGEEPVTLTWSNPSSGIKILKIMVDIENQVLDYSMSDNKLNIPLTISEQTSNGNGGGDDGDSSLPALGYMPTLFLLALITIVQRRKNNN